MNWNKWKPYGRICRDIDERAGSGVAEAPAADPADDILSIFRMDFEDKAESAVESASGQAPAESSSPSVQSEAPEPSSQEQVPASSASKSAPVQEPGSESEVQAPSAEPAPQPAGPKTEELLAKALEVNQRLAAQLEAQKQARSEEPSQPEEDEDTKVFAPRQFSDYTFNINPKLYEGLFSAEATQEDRIQCLQAYASGIATTVHNRVLESLGSWTKQNFEAVPRVVQMLIQQNSRATQTGADIRQDFYSKNPDLKRQELYPLLKATIQTVQKETKATAWTPQFADKVASRMRGILAGYAQASKPQAAAPIMTPAAAKPAPKVVETDPNGADEIFATLSNEF